MNEFEIVQIRDLDGNELGYTIWQMGSQNLETVNIYESGDDSIQDRVAELNANLRLREHWPDARDPEFQALVSDPEWEPIQLDPRTGEAADPRAMMNRLNKAARLIAERRLQGEAL